MVQSWRQKKLAESKEKLQKVTFQIELYKSCNDVLFTCYCIRLVSFWIDAQNGKSTHKSVFFYSQNQSNREMPFLSHLRRCFKLDELFIILIENVLKSS